LDGVHCHRLTPTAILFSTNRYFYVIAPLFFERRAAHANEHSVSWFVKTKIGHEIKDFLTVGCDEPSPLEEFGPLLALFPLPEGDYNKPR